MISLSICIATRNRASYIGETLDSIIPQLDDGTELVIVDGASTDETPQIVAERQQRSSRIRYHHLEENGGVDRDYATAVDLATGRYCWLFADDDVFKPGAIARVRSHLDEGHSLIVVNAEVRNADLSEVVIASRVGFDDDRTYAIGEDDRLLADTGVFLSFIGCVVIDRAFWQQRDKEAFFGSEFIHFGVIFQAPLPSSAFVIATPQTEIRYGNAMWTARGFEIWMSRWPALVWSMPRSEAAKKKVVSRERWRNPLMLLGHRAIGAYSIDEYRKVIAPRHPSMLQRVLAGAIARVPGRPLNAFARGVLRMMPRTLPMLALDLRRSRFYR